jgi:hypothetical protein
MHKNSPKSCGRPISLLLVATCLFVGTAGHLNAQQPFPFLQPGLTQELFATGPLPPGEIDGGIAFAPNGDLWVDSCNRNTLFKFQSDVTTVVNGTPVHPQAPGSPISVIAGCGLTNHPDGTMYSNTGGGVTNLDAITGAQLRPTFGPQGNGLGIAVDPQTDNLIYVGGIGGSCFGTPPCTIVSVNPVTAVASTFANLDPADATFIDGIFFDPTGNFLFMAVRNPDRGLTVLNRNGAVIQHVSMNTFPDGVAFHTQPDYVVTNDNSGTISRFDFPGDDFTAAPTQSLIASGGFRGDLSQVGPDACLYVTQAGTRFLDGTLSADNSVVRICPNFVPQPGVVPAHFVIGDNDAAVGGQVTFWGAQWAKDNSLTGGAAPRAFKGFAASGAQGCGSAWSSDPGDSSNPPDTVSPFIAVIVSSATTQSGSTITGDVSKIVIVRTDPGYGPAPGHGGTGTVVSVVCGN